MFGGTTRCHIGGLTDFWPFLYFNDSVKKGLNLLKKHFTNFLFFYSLSILLLLLQKDCIEHIWSQILWRSVLDWSLVKQIVPIVSHVMFLWLIIQYTILSCTEFILLHYEKFLTWTKFRENNSLTTV